MLEVYPSIVEKLFTQKSQMEAWFESQWKEDLKIPFYSSVDLRDSGFKLAPVDVNLYPGGFNNLSAYDLAQAIELIRPLIDNQIRPGSKRLLIIAEAHTRNSYYLENIARIRELLQKADLDVKLSMLTQTPHTLETPSGESLTFEVLEREGNYLKIGNFIPEGIILNNDLTTGLPSILTQISQPIIPSPHLGWHTRLKSNYFQQYDIVCQNFSKAFNWDAWLFSPLFSYCDGVDFTQSKEPENLLEEATQLLNKIAEKYYFYRLDQKPYLMIKADSGSYGMGVLKIESIEDIVNLSRRKRQHMAKTKGNQAIRRVILQEGVPTIVRSKQYIAEPVLYSLGAHVVGGFYRTHKEQDAKENLNTPGMALTPLSIKNPPEEAQKSLYAYTVIARLTILAAALETEALTQSSPNYPKNSLTDDMKLA